MLIIGFTGAPGAGKDTAFEIVRESVSAAGLLAERFSFADALREVADHMLSLAPGHGYWDHPTKEEPCLAFGGHTPREFLIELGMLGRKYRANLWCDIVFKRLLDPVETSADVAVITDVRFANEARALKAAGGTLVEIIRPGHDYDQRRVSESGQASEYADYRVLNERDIDDFSRAIEGALWNLISKGGLRATA